MLLLRLSRNADPCVWFFSYSSYGVHRNHPVLTHSFPTRRSSDLLASITYFSVLDTRPVVHEILIGVFVTVTTPVTLILLARATRFRGLVEPRSEEHTSELQSLMRISYAVFCLKKNKKH